MVPSEIVNSTLIAFIFTFLLVMGIFRYSDNRITDGEFRILVGMIAGAAMICLLFIGVALLYK